MWFESLYVVESLKILMCLICVLVKIIVRWLREEELEEHFRKFGSVSQVHIVVDKDTKRSKGIAYVLYSLPESAARYLSISIQILSYCNFLNLLLYLQEAHWYSCYKFRVLYILVHVLTLHVLVIPHIVHLLFSRALTELDSSIFQGRLLHVMPAKQKVPSEKTE